MHGVNVPHLHHFLLAFIHICELVYHLPSKKVNHDATNLCALNIYLKENM